MKMSTCIMAHPVREQQVVELIDQLGEQVPVQWDLAGPPSSDPEQRWANGRQAWERFNPLADFHMVIQDDALVVPDLVSGLEKALEYVPPETLVQPYVGTKKPSLWEVTAATVQAEMNDASWIDMRSLKWGVAIIVPTHAIMDMLTWCNAQTGVSYDKRIGVYFRDVLKWRVWYPWPSFVDHRDESIIGHDNGRRARKMFDGSALDFDPTGSVITSRYGKRS